MNEKKRDEQKRWRNKIVAFRMSQEENEQLDKFVKLSGKNKQEYLISKTLNRDIVVFGNSRIYKVLKELLEEVYQELKRIDNASEISSELKEIILQINMTMNGLQLNEKSPYPGR